mmetsp:Transcript_9905/g.9749  ORF Transcript_9905/g.9749 Transcript_9905/m.9749 type:complete len:210 (+) Transcript_9905:421-1050(+)
MAENNIAQSKDFKFSNIYWLLSDKEFYFEALRILKSKNLFDYVIWSFSIFHKDFKTLKEFFSSNDNLVKIVGPDFETSLIKVNGEDDADDRFNFLDYYPLVNSRAHRVGGMDILSQSSKETQQWILNVQQRETYKKFLVHLVYKKGFPASDKLKLVTYLIMQERIQEAFEQFQKIKMPEGDLGNSQIQYDYLASYFDFYENGQKQSFVF